MKAKWFLNQAFVLHSEIKIKQEQISSMQDLIMNLSVPMDREKVLKSPEPSPMERDIAQLALLEEELKNEIARLTIVEQQIMEIVNKIENVKARAVLSKHYLCFKSWSDIADELDISQKWAFNLHTKGLHEVESLLADRATSFAVEMEES